MYLNEVNYIERTKRYLLSGLKQEIEVTYGCKLAIQPNKIVIKSKNFLVIDKVRKIIEALNLGFDLNVVKLLLKEDYDFDIIDVRDYVRKNKKSKDLKRILARVIGKKGKTRKTFEELGSVHIKITGPLIGIIGHQENILPVKHYLLELIEGKPHSHVYSDLVRYKRCSDYFWK